MGRPSKDASRMRRKRENETEEARNARLAKCRTYNAARRCNETEDVRQLRLSKMREYYNWRKRRLHRLETCRVTYVNRKQSVLTKSNAVVPTEVNEHDAKEEEEDSDFCSVQSVKEEVLTEINAVVPTEEQHNVEEEEIKPPVAVFIKQEVTEEEDPCALNAESNDDDAAAAASVNASGAISEDDPEYCISADQVKTEKQTDRKSDTSSSEYIIPGHLSLTLSNKRFSSEDDVRCEDTTEKPYECTICKMRFSLKFLCDIHQQIHAGQKPHECHICKSTFTQKTNLLCHLRIHEKPYECAVCKKCFSTRLACDKHMQTHTGVKPYECSICRKSFSQKWNLLRHIPSHNDEKTYVCNFCKKNFFIHSQLMCHIKTHLLMNLSADLEKQKQTREKT